MQSNTIERKNTIVRITCILLAVLMFLLLFLPVVKLNITEVLEELYDGLDSDERILIEAIGETDFLKGVAEKFSKLELSDFGRKSNSYGYEDGSLEDRIWDLEDEIDDIFYYGGDVDDLIRLLQRDNVQSLIAEELYASIVYASYESGANSDKAVSKTVKNIQTLMEIGTKNKLTPVQSYRELNAVVNMVSGSDSSFLRDYFDSDTTMKLEDSIQSLKTARALYFLFLLAYAVFTLLAVASSALAKKKIAQLSGIAATLLAVIYTIALYAAKGKMVDGIESMVYGYYSFDKLVSVTAWPIIIVLIGIVFCFLVSGIKKKVSAARPNKGWVCTQCGSSRLAEEAFCANCGARRPEIKELICPQCGAKVENGDVFCSECGVRLDSQYVTM